MKNFYLLLQIPDTATAFEIKAAYRKLSKKFHPDLNQDNKACEEKFKDLQEAYSILKDPVKRKDYDLRLNIFNQETAAIHQSQQKFHSPRVTSTATIRKAGKKPEKGDQTGIRKSEIMWGAGIAFTLSLIVFILIGIEKTFNARESYLENIETKTQPPQIDSLNLIQGFRQDSIFSKTSSNNKN